MRMIERVAVLPALVHMQGVPMSDTLFRLDGRNALVTGAASGIGRRIAVGLAEFGADVCLVDRAGSDLDGAADDVDKTGRRAVTAAADVTSSDGIRAAVRRAETVLGPLRFAVNSAGIANASSAEDMDLAQWQRMLDINLTGVFLSCQAEGRAMLEHGGGAIVNIASMSGSIVNRGLLQAHYNASKAGVIQLTKSLAMEWCRRRVRVNSISPGYTATPMNTRPEVAEQVKKFEADTPLGRMASVDEMVGPAVFLLSDAASFCTGVDLLVDGGFVCW
jgi:NAD(P)-dependent dehydrogenase (short-subunit alcohol dehydrogenase family)